MTLSSRYHMSPAELEGTGCSQRRRGEDFRLIVMSATLDAGKFVTYLGATKAAYIQVRSHYINQGSMIHELWACSPSYARGNFGYI